MEVGNILKLRLGKEPSIKFIDYKMFVEITNFT